MVRESRTDRLGALTIASISPSTSTTEEGPLMDVGVVDPVRLPKVDGYLGELLLRLLVLVFVLMLLAVAAAKPSPPPSRRSCWSQPGGPIRRFLRRRLRLRREATERGRDRARTRKDARRQDQLDRLRPSRLLQRDRRSGGSPRPAGREG